MEYGAAREFIAKYFEVRPKLKEYIDNLRQQAQDQGYVETIMGRRRPTPDVNSSNFAVREGAYRAAINHPMQGSAADLMKMAMVEVAQKLGDGSNMLLQIHDSILAECPASETKATGKVLKDVMEYIYPKLPVKLKVDISSGKNWGEL
jgi:DNA polymerase-1